MNLQSVGTLVQAPAPRPIHGRANLRTRPTQSLARISRLLPSDGRSPRRRPLEDRRIKPLVEPTNPDWLSMSSGGLEQFLTAFCLAVSRVLDLDPAAIASQSLCTVSPCVFRQYLKVHFAH